MSQRYCVLDYETRSTADLRAVGGYEYARHDSTRILCVGWKVGTREELPKKKATVWSPALGGQPTELVEALLNPTVHLLAHNSFFEQVITRFVLSRILYHNFDTPISRWTCTASLARACALPGNLEGACAALKLPVQKDMEGRRLMLKYCKPRHATIYNTDQYHAKTADLKRLMQYCGTDVDAEALLFLALPPLIPIERKVWELDQEINWRGFRINRPLVAKILTLIDEETKALDQETRDITEGWLHSTRQREKLLDVLKKFRCYIPDVQKKTLEDWLRGDFNLHPTAKRLLEIRQSISKTSTAKYEGFNDRSQSDGRVRDSLVYHLAAPGRWGGAGLQPQNFPRPTLKNIALEDLETGDLDWIRAIYGNPMEVFSSALRNMIEATPGKLFHCGDYAAIEARVLFWLAKHEEGLKAFREGRDLYREMAARIYRVKLEDVTKEQRELGKRAILGCGYGMGPKKFRETCEAQGQPVSEELAELAVQTYREVHQPVVALWKKIERASIAAAREVRKKFTINRTSWWVEYGFLWCELPSGRRNAYHQPQVKFEPTSWGEKRPRLYHWGVNPKTRKWNEEGTYGGRMVENCVQGIARDLMAAAMLRLEAENFQVVLSVHDELLTEYAGQDLEKFTKLMATTPDWAEGCPVKVDSWVGPIYRKG